MAAKMFNKISKPQDVKYVAELDLLNPNDPRYIPLEDVRQDSVPMDLYKRLKGAIDHPGGADVHPLIYESGLYQEAYALSREHEKK